MSGDACFFFRRVLLSGNCSAQGTLAHAPHNLPYSFHACPDTAFFNLLLFFLMVIRCARNSPGTVGEAMPQIQHISYSPLLVLLLLWCIDAVAAMDTAEAKMGLNSGASMALAAIAAAARHFINRQRLR